MKKIIRKYMELRLRKWVAKRAIQRTCVGEEFSEVAQKMYDWIAGTPAQRPRS